MALAAPPSRAREMHKDGQEMHFQMSIQSTRRFRPAAEHRGRAARFFRCSARDCDADSIHSPSSPAAGLRWPVRAIFQMRWQRASLAPVNALQTIGALGDDPLAGTLQRRGNHHAGAEDERSNKIQS
jgi:hypothetical protein